METLMMYSFVFE